MAFRIPQTFTQAVEGGRPDRIVFIGPTDVPPDISTSAVEHWRLSDPSGKSVDFMRELRDVIEKHVTEQIRSSNAKKHHQ